MSATSKAAKKNIKKRENKRKNKQHEVEQPAVDVIEENIPLKDPLTILKEKLAEAKASGDHKAAAKYRQDIWVLQDVTAGIQPELDEELVNSSLQRIPKKAEPAVIEKETSNSSFDKELRKINKKLMQIEKLKQLKEKGEKLEESQLQNDYISASISVKFNVYVKPAAKIEKESALREEANELEKLISEMVVTR